MYFFCSTRLPTAAQKVKAVRVKHKDLPQTAMNTAKKTVAPLSKKWVT